MFADGQVRFHAELCTPLLPRAVAASGPELDLLDQSEPPPHLATRRVHAHRTRQPRESLAGLPRNAADPRQQDKSFTLTLFAPKSIFDTLDAQIFEGVKPHPVVALFESEFPDALKLMGKDELLASYRDNPKDGLITIEVRSDFSDL